MPVGPIVAVPMLLAAGFTMSGAFGGAVRGDDTIRFSLLFIISYTFLAFSGLPPRKLYTLDAFPLPRRFIFAAMFVPYVAILGLGYGAGRIVADKGERGRELITFIERDDHYYLSAPLRNGAIALDGSPPAAVAPWGESHEVWSRPIWAGKTPVVHSLFSTPPGSSPEFVAWQITRAAREIYGADIAAGEVLERYLTTDDGGRVVPVGGELTLAADHPDWRVSSHGPVFPAVMLLVCGLWFVALSLYLADAQEGHVLVGDDSAHDAARPAARGVPHRDPRPLGPVGHVHDRRPCGGGTASRRLCDILGALRGGVVRALPNGRVPLPPG